MRAVLKVISCLYIMFTAMEKYGTFLALKHLHDECKLKITKMIHDDDSSVRSLIQKVFIDIEEQLCVGKMAICKSNI